LNLSEKRICITGGHGFVGQNVCELLKKDNVNFVNASRKKYDLTKMNSCKQLFEDINPQVLIHLAADAGGLGYNTKYPADIFVNNVLMNTNIIKASALFNLEKLVIINSACAYPGYSEGILKEKDIFDGPLHQSVEPYGFSKRGMIIASRAFKSQYNLNSINLVLTNVYGKYDKFDDKESHVVAAFIKKFERAKIDGDKEVVCWGTGKAIRELMHTDDLSRAILFSCEKYDDSTPLNIGTGIGTTIKELAESVSKIVGFKGKIVWDTTKPDGAMKKVLDVSKMKKSLSWEPTISLDEGLKMTYKWYLESQKHE